MIFPWLDRNHYGPRMDASYADEQRETWAAVAEILGPVDEDTRVHRETP